LRVHHILRLYYQELMAEIRAAIAAKRFAEFAATFRQARAAS
jgi:queuine/archaeosine tRNA-ribosyltransferase